jgi:hypothetical protein
VRQLLDRVREAVLEHAARCKGRQCTHDLYACMLRVQCVDIIGLLNNFCGHCSVVCDLSAPCCTVANYVHTHAKIKLKCFTHATVSGGNWCNWSVHAGWQSTHHTQHSRRSSRGALSQAKHGYRESSRARHLWRHPTDINDQI